LQNVNWSQLLKWVITVGLLFAPQSWLLRCVDCAAAGCAAAASPNALLHCWQLLLGQDTATPPRPPPGRTALNRQTTAGLLMPVLQQQP
jgi:hypothetical protein